MTDTNQSRMLQSQYLLQMTLADMDREANNGRYSTKGLACISQSAAIQLKLAKCTEGETAQLHRRESARLTSLLERELGVKPEPVRKAEPQPPVTAPAPAPPHSAPAKPRTADSELPADFDPSAFIMKPSDDSLEDLHANRDVVERICNSFRDQNSFRKRFPNATRHWRSRKHRATNVLLFGPPATGKTHLCRCISNFIAKEYPGESAFYHVSAMDIASKWVGQTGRILKAIFDDARRFKYAVICVDEIEELCMGRDSDSNKVNYTTNFLELLDGVAGKSNAMFIACTNYPWRLDHAMLSRLHMRSMLDYPDAGDIAAFFGNSEEYRDWMGATAAEADAMIERISAVCAERHFSYRNLETLCSLMGSRAEEKTCLAYPDGSKELERILPLSEDEIMELIDATGSDYDESVHRRYIQYHDLRASGKS